jgi:hypothetical protein
LAEIKAETDQLLSIKQGQEAKLAASAEKVQNQVYKTELCRDDRGVLEEMVLIR